MNHELEIYKILQENGVVAWGCSCSCGWKTFRRQNTARYAQLRGNEHIAREEARIVKADA